MTDARTERWKLIDGTDGAFEVSTLGRVRRLIAMRHGFLQAGDILQFKPNKRGYLVFGSDFWSGGEKRRVRRLVHKMVMETFVGPCPRGFHTAHLNGDRGDPRLENLVYATPRENSSHRIGHGTTCEGERHGSSKITRKQAEEILSSEDSDRIAAAKYGVSPGTVNSIRRGATWKHISTPRPQTEAGDMERKAARVGVLERLRDSQVCLGEGGERKRLVYESDLFAITEAYEKLRVSLELAEREILLERTVA